MEKSSQDIKKVAPRLGGYHYEFQVGALRLLDLLEGKADKIEFESARDSSDRLMTSRSFMEIKFTITK